MFSVHCVQKQNLMQVMTAAASRKSKPGYFSIKTSVQHDVKLFFILTEYKVLYVNQLNDEVKTTISIKARNLKALVHCTTANGWQSQMDTIVMTL